MIVLDNQFYYSYLKLEKSTIFLIKKGLPFGNPQLNNLFYRKLHTTGDRQIFVNLPAPNRIYCVLSHP